jgi:hypothetical protein
MKRESYLSWKRAKQKRRADRWDRRARIYISCVACISLLALIAVGLWVRSLLAARALSRSNMSSLSLLRVASEEVRWAHADSESVCTRWQMMPEPTLGADALRDVVQANVDGQHRQLVDLKRRRDLDSERRRQSSFRLAAQGIYFGWLAEGNVGDELLFDSFVRMLASYLERRYGGVARVSALVDTVGDRGFAPARIDVCDGVALDEARADANDRQTRDVRRFVVLGGGSTLGTSAEYVAAMARDYAVVDVPSAELLWMLFGSGVDDYDGVLDIEATRDALADGRIDDYLCPLLAETLAIDSGDQRAALWAESLRVAMPRFGYGSMRGELSAAMVRCALAARRRGTTLASLLPGGEPPLPPAHYDIGLLAADFFGRDDDPGDADMTERHRQSQLLPSCTLALNVGGVGADGMPASQRAVHFSAIGRALLDRFTHCRVQVYSMQRNDAPLARHVVRALRKHATAASTMRVPDEHLAGGAADVLRVVRSADVNVAYKLHSAVLSVAALTPTVMLAYRAKLVDFAHSIDSLDYLVPFSSASDRRAAPPLVSALCASAIGGSAERALIVDRLRARVAEARARITSEFIRFGDALMNNLDIDRIDSQLLSDMPIEALMPHIRVVAGYTIAPAPPPNYSPRTANGFIHIEVEAILR